MKNTVRSLRFNGKTASIFRHNNSTEWTIVADSTHLTVPSYQQALKEALTAVNYGSENYADDHTQKQLLEKMWPQLVNVAHRNISSVHPADTPQNDLNQLLKKNQTILTNLSNDVREALQEIQERMETFSKL